MPADCGSPAQFSNRAGRRLTGLLVLLHGICSVLAGLPAFRTSFTAASRSASTPIGRKGSVKAQLAALPTNQDTGTVDWRRLLPKAEYSATDVVQIQLQALKENNPLDDDGLAKTFAFASLKNQAMTGPFPRFANMIRRGYPDMLNCASFTILSALPVQQSVYAVRVEIVANDENGGDAKKYFWILGNCGTGWRTESVMPDTSFDIEDDED
eukprot:TRINITY_DN28127_c0_g1_i4.p1 TRINITY_DN28127_c0_g1~~TRINITY_DN28127_c0_g1_i4.p1  ORF type:complete len:211 (+),score=19.66 TRINITY_DN28127_c0_g1_i4:87-719(+)